MNNVLPIGSVVKIKDLSVPLMIFGYMQETSFRPGVVSDYIAVPYPQGNVNLAMQVGFQLTDIVEVLFKGYETKEFEPIKMILEMRNAGIKVKSKKD